MKTDDAIAAFGDAKKLADALGIWPQAIYKWGDEVPPLRAYQIQEILDKARKNG
jgi:transcriptional repressor of cell division inhibition gene dicB